MMLWCHSPRGIQHYRAGLRVTHFQFSLYVELVHNCHFFLLGHCTVDHECRDTGSLSGERHVYHPYMGRRPVGHQLLCIQRAPRPRGFVY